jgi:hypothetical protein
LTAVSSPRTPSPGSSTSPGYGQGLTYANPIQAVLDALKSDLVL